jgi:hypothetical protein
MFAYENKETSVTQILTWNQHCGGDVVSDTTGAGCYVVQKVTLLGPVIASPGQTQMLVDWSCSPVVVGQVGVWPARKLESLAASPQHHFLLHHSLMRMRSHMQRVTGLHTAAAAEGIKDIKKHYKN